MTSGSVYYGNGVRRSHTVNGVATTYTYDVGAGLPVVLQDGTNTLVYGLDLISTTDAGGTQRYFSYDGLGSVTNLTDGTGAVTDTYSYDVFGAVRARTGTNVSPWKYTGEQEDGAAGDSGYYFLRARYLDTATGRFISKDPVEFDQRYAYANNNPTRLVDPSGLASERSGPSEGESEGERVGMALGLLDQLKGLKPNEIWKVLTRQSVTVYRAVSQQEFDELLQTGAFSSGPPGTPSYEFGKFFWSSLDEAERWTQLASANGWAGADRIISAKLPYSTVRLHSVTYENMDGIGTAHLLPLRWLTSAVVSAVR